ncbi:sigma-70 family RNA polymerase sigma factor [Pseudonocardia sp. GCM10023141]|uniref:sigma-70 family RNA polymerase sigma factor n=1 Tax=Pseudonocardia sp. GCM10023141 TaxID=3252653 RepID=UPI00360A172F
MTEVVDSTAKVHGTWNPEFEKHRVELTGYCYRMLGSAFDAEDAVQETLVRAWKAYDRFEGRSSLRSWLYRIATNVCLTMLEGRGRRARPMDFGPAAMVESAQLGEPHGEATWLQPVPDARVLPTEGDPADRAIAKESIRLAFVAALQHLPPRQRAVLILREVLQWSAAETAELLGSTVASVNSALQRSRATLAAQDLSVGGGSQAFGEEQQALLERYADAFERYDIASLVTLLHEDAVLSMPPYELWITGPVEIEKWWAGPGIGCAGSRLVPVQVNGATGFGQYRPSNTGSGHDAWALQVVEVAGDRVVGLNAFLDTAIMFPLFGLPLHLD